MEFGREDCEEARILDSWVDDRVDVRNKIRRGRWILSRVKDTLVKRVVVVQNVTSPGSGACVENSVLYDCQA